MAGRVESGNGRIYFTGMTETFLISPRFQMAFWMMMHTAILYSPNQPFQHKMLFISKHPHK